MAACCSPGPAIPTCTTPSLATFLGRSLTFFSPNPVNPYSVRWNIDVQRQIGKGLLYEIGYTGNRSVHLPVDQQLDFLPRQYLSTSPTRDQVIIDRNSSNVA